MTGHAVRRLAAGWLLLAAAVLAGCTTNPVTGERNFQLYGAEWEQEVGAQMYAPMKQSQGGEFILDPELTAYVQGVGERLAARSRRGSELDYEFSVLNSSVPNAWALPGGKIVVNRGLLTELDSEAQLAAVLGHEIVHADASHGARAQSKAMVTQAGAILSMIVLGSTIPSGAGREVAMQVPLLGAQLVTQKYGRDAERESDEYGMLYMSEAGYDPQGAVRLQETFVRLSEGRDEDWLGGLFASHPASQERVRNNRATAKRLPAGGELGTERYREKLAYLRRVQPAYEAFDEANKALADEDLEKAQSLVSRALAIEPREAFFHLLQGDIHRTEGRLDKAGADYRRGIEANPALFLGYLRRGQVGYQQDRWQSARADLDRSLELLPTAEAHYLLGMLDRRDGDDESAIEHFRAAANSESEAGQNALRELVLLDLPANPSRYVAIRPGLDAANVLWVELKNASPVPVEDIEVSYAWLDESGRTRQERTTYAGPLSPGQQHELRLDVVFAGTVDLQRRVRAEVTAARPVAD